MSLVDGVLNDESVGEMEDSKRGELMKSTTLRFSTSHGYVYEGEEEDICQSQSQRGCWFSDAFLN